MMISERWGWRGKTCPECGCHHPLDWGSQLNKKEKVSQVSTFKKQSKMNVGSHPQHDRLFFFINQGQKYALLSFSCFFSCIFHIMRKVTNIALKMKYKCDYLILSILHVQRTGAEYRLSICTRNIKRTDMQLEMYNLSCEQWTDNQS